MKAYPPLGAATIGAIANWILGVGKQRTDDVTEIAQLKNKYLTGRVRTDRTYPAGHADVNATDKEGDIVRSTTHEVVLINASGTLTWAQSALDITW